MVLKRYKAYNKSKIDSFFRGRSVFNQSLTSGTKRNLYGLIANFLTPEANLRPC